MRALIYYPFFPTYRLGILRELAGRTDMSFRFAAGVSGRAGIDSITSGDFPELVEMRTRLLGGLRWTPGILRLALRRDVDLVVMAPATMSISVWTVLWVRWLLRRPTLLWGQCGKPGSRGLKRIAQEVMNRLATGLLVYGESERRGATSLGTAGAKVHIVHNAVEHDAAVTVLGIDELIRRARARGIGSGMPQSPLTLTYIGRLNPSKRVDLLLDAIEALRGEHPEIRGIVVGEGTESEAIRRKVESRRLPVEIMGAVYGSAAIAEILAETTLVVAPSEIGLLAIDALQHGVPVVYADNDLGNGPEVEALTLGLNALRFEPGGGGAVEGAVRSWLALAPTLDPREYCLTSVSALDTWSPSAVADRIVQAISSEIRPTPGEP